MHKNCKAAARQSAIWSAIVFSLFGFALAKDCDQKGWISERRAANEDEDPFANPFAMAPEDDASLSRPFKTTGGYDVKPWVSFWEVEEDQWPKIPAPLTFSSSFEEPKAVWRTEGGFFASFNAGEFGAGLFYGDQKATKWNRLFRAHIDSLYDFDSDVYIAVGGLAHLSMEKGEVYLVARAADGGWDSRLLFESNVGVPKVIGESKTHMYSSDSVAKRLLVFVVCSHSKTVEEIFGVSEDGVIYALGSRILENKDGE